MRITKRTLALGFIQDVTGEVVIQIYDSNGFRGRNFTKIVWIKTPTIKELDVARQGFEGVFAWLCDRTKVGGTISN